MRRMARHGSGQDLGRFGELSYRFFLRLPDWVGFVIPIGLFLVLLGIGDALAGTLHRSAGWLRADSTYEAFALWVIPLLAFLVALIVFEMALITYFLRTGRWKLLHLQSSMRDIRSLSSRDFERLVGAAYEQQGYRVGYASDGQDGDIDLIMRRGRETALVQCKNWYRSWTGVPEVRELYGVMTAEKATLGILVTSGVFSDEAIAFAKGKPLHLVDGETLHEMIESVQGSVGPTPREAMKKPAQAAAALNHEKLCPICKSPTIRKVARRGDYAGNSFWSCSRFPKCYGIAPE
jgi:restriction system protein